MTTIATSHRQAVRTAFAALRKQGFIARMNYSCCSSCAWAAIAGNLRDKGLDLDETGVIFYNRQSAESFEGDTLAHDLYLQWQGDAEAIVTALREQGLAATWNGSEHQTVIVRALPLGTTPEQVEDLLFERECAPVLRDIRDAGTDAARFRQRLAEGGPEWFATYAASADARREAAVERLQALYTAAGRAHALAA